jgi:hypothetical membrane protein
MAEATVSDAPPVGSPPKRLVTPARARYGGVFLLVGVAEFLIGMAVAQVGYGSSYSVSQNLLSDLGVTSCGPIDSTGRSACSPWFLAFDVSTFILGLLVVYAAVWTRRAFPAGILSVSGLGLLAVHGLGLIGAGTTPENLSYSAHTAFALLTFSSGAMALIILGIAMDGTAHWKGFRAYSVASGLVSGVTLLLFVGGSYLGLGPGGAERLIVAPILLWFVVVGIHLVRTPAASLDRRECGITA